MPAFGRPIQRGRGPMLLARPVRTLEDRVNVLRGLTWGTGPEGPIGSLRDPRMRQIGLMVTQHCPPRNDLCELKAIFDFIVRNVRYTGDITNKDTFQSALRTLQYGGGDCFPHGTLFLTRDGFVPVEQVEVGDEIHDGRRWVSVLKTWDRGFKRVLRFRLNNGCVLRLSDTHKTLVVPRIRSGEQPGVYESAVETVAAEIRVGDDLLQPRGFEGAGTDELSDDDAFLFGAYLAEGCRSHKKVGGADKYISIAGVAGSKMIRERTIEILKRRDIPFTEREREVKFHAEFFPEVYGLGRIAIEKHLPTLTYGPKTVAGILRAMEMGDGGMSTSGKSMVYSTISPTLALQYRVLKRMMGQSVGWHSLTGEEHGGFGQNTLHRLTVREENARKPWAKVKSIEAEDEESPCYDVMTESGRVYLPEADVITRQCDDHAELGSVLGMENGFAWKWRITSNTGATWDHIYSMAGIPKHSPSDWIALDTTLGAGRFGREPRREKYRDFLVSQSEND